MSALWAKLRALLTGKRGFEAGLDDEMRAHLEFEIEESLARGVPPEAARADALRRFGNATVIAERSREAWGFRWLADLARDLRYSVRSLRRRPVFAATAVVSLALALGPNTAVFSFAKAIVLKRLPVPGADRLVNLRQKNEMFHMENCCFGYRFFLELRKQRGDFEDVLATSQRDVTLTDREENERVNAEFVSGNYFRMLGVRPAAGRLLDETDDASEGASPVCVISYQFWNDRFARDPAAVGRQISLDGHRFRIVGVSQRGFSGASLRDRSDLEIPTAMVEPFFESKRDSFGFLFFIARLKPGVTLAHAASWLNAIGHPIQNATSVRMGPHDDFLLYDGSQGLDSRREEVGKPVLVLLLLVGVLLLAACANIAALLLVRSVERTREAGVRAAIGASRSALFRQFLAEALILAVAGGALGWSLAFGLVRILLTMLPRDTSLAQAVRPDAAVFAFSAALAVLAALLFGLLPAWRASGADALPAIHGMALAARGRRQRFASSAIIAGQIALSLALVFCAGLFARTLHNLRAIDLGFEASNIVILPVNLENTAYAGAAPAFFNELLRRVRGLPGTRAASLAGQTLITGAMSSMVLKVPGYLPVNGMSPTSYVTWVSAGYFRTLTTPFLAGRDFIGEDTDGRDGEGAAIVNEQFARRFLGGDALGKQFAYGGGRKVRVVGVVRTAKFRYIREEPQPVYYLPITPRTLSADFILQARVTGDLDAAIARIRSVVRKFGPHAPIGPIDTMEMEIDAALSRERMLAFLSTFLGAVAAVLAAIGLYGVLSFAVTARTKEIGIRISVGARRGAIAGLFLRESAWMAAAGIALGIPLMLACGKLAGSLLYGLQGEDPLTVAGASVALIVVAVAAALIPSARAARTDPVRALRHE